MASTAAVLNILVTANTSKANTALAATQGNLKKTATTAGASSAAIGRSMSSVGKTMTRSVTVPVLAAGAVATKFALDFHDQMGQLENQAGATGKEVERMSKRVLALSESGKSTHGPRELATALFTVESAGLRGAKAMNVLRSAEQLATVGNADLEETVKGVTTAMKVGLKGTGSTKKAVGQLNAIIGQGRLRMDELNSAMGTGFLTSAKEVGVSLAGVGAALATMTDQGIPAVKSATSLRMMFKGLAAPTKAGEAAFKRIGLSADDLAKTMQKKGLLPALQELQGHLGGMSKVGKTQFLAEAFGVKSSTAISVLLGNLKAMGDRQDNINKKAKEFGSIWRKEMQDPDSKLAAGMAQLETMMVKLGTELLPAVVPALTTIMGVVKGVFDAFNKLPGPVQKIIVVFGFVVAALGPLLTVFGGLITILPKVAVALKAVGAAALANPWVLLAVAVAAAAFLIIKNWDKVKAALGAVWDWIKGAAKTVGEAVLWAAEHGFLGPIPLIISRWKDIRNILGNVWGWIKGAASTVFNALTWPFRKGVELIGNVIGGVRKAVSNAIGFVKEHWPSIKQVLFGPFQGLARFVGSVFDAVRDKVVGVVDTIIDVLNKLPGVDIGKVGAKAPPGPKGPVGTGGGPSGPGGPVGAQRGVLVPGSGSGDKVPALLEPGEVVWNRKAVSTLFGNAENADAANKIIPRFRQGGVAARAPSWYIKQLPDADAFPGWSRGAGKLAIDKAAKFIKNKVTDAGSFGGIAGSGTKLMKAISQRKGWNFADWWSLDAAESQHGTNLVNPTSTARLRGQFLDMNWGKYGPGSDPTPWPSMRDQIISMARYIQERYGNPSKAWAFHQGNNYYQRGGIVQGLQKGGMVGNPYNEKLMRGSASGPPRLNREDVGGFLPKSIGRIKAKADSIANSFTGYVWGGGHNAGAVTTNGLDCSGAVAKLVQQSGWPEFQSAHSSVYASRFKPGAGDKFSIYSNDGHTFVDIMGKQWGTNSSNGLGYASHTLSGYAASHPELAKAQAAAPPTATTSTAHKKLELTKAQKRRLGKLTKDIRKIGGLDKALGFKAQGRLDELSGNAELWGEYADRASQLTDEESGVLGVVNGLNEQQWVEKQLTDLFKLRNHLIRAQEAIAKAREKIIDKLKKLAPGGVAKGSGKELSATARKSLQERLRKELKKPKAKQNASLVASLQGQLSAGAKVSRPQTAFNKEALASLQLLDSTLSTKSGELGEVLLTTQGAGSPMGVLKSLPTLGTLGGSIFDAQIRLKELGVKPNISDSGESESAELLRGLLREANQRFAVSQAQYPILQGLANVIPFGGSFATGGMVPGAIGQPMMIQAHGGETVAPVGAEPVVNVTFTGGAEFLRKFIKVEVQKQGKRDARGVGRTPGSAGSLRG